MKNNKNIGMFFSLKKKFLKGKIIMFCKFICKYKTEIISILGMIFVGIIYYLGMLAHSLSIKKREFKKTYIALINFIFDTTTIHKIDFKLADLKDFFSENPELKIINKYFWEKWLFPIHYNDNIPILKYNTWEKNDINELVSDLKNLKHKFLFFKIKII